jgi:hypothetical protein
MAKKFSELRAKMAQKRSLELWKQLQDAANLGYHGLCDADAECPTCRAAFLAVVKAHGREG